jgi:hypothetical protein
MLLKCLWRPQWSAAYFACFDALSKTYLEAVRWEPRAEIEARTARLLPGLLLARVDGKSPVEYLLDDTVENRKARDAVRRTGRRFLLQPASRLADIRGVWQHELTMWNAQHA